MLLQGALLSALIHAAFNGDLLKGTAAAQQGDGEGNCRVAVHGHPEKWRALLHGYAIKACAS
jgi:hypothetical protein